MNSRTRASFVLLVAGLLIPVGCNAAHQAREQVTLKSNLQAGNGAKRLVVANKVGNIIIDSDPAAQQVSAEVTKIGKGSTHGEAQKAVDEIVVVLEESKSDPGVVNARAEHPDGGSRQYEVVWHITAPPGVELDIHNGVGDIEASGFEHGAHIIDGVGNVHANKISGGLHAKTDTGHIRAESDGRTHLESGVGNVALVLNPKSPEDVFVKSGVGNVEVRLPTDRRGSMNAEAGVGSIVTSLEGISTKSVRQEGNHVNAELGGQTSPSIKLASGVGNVHIKTQ